jgi:hypothetical protein
MNPVIVLLAACVLAGAALPAAAQGKGDPSEWTVYLTNDNCPDYTWGLTESQTRKAFADIVRAHLDEMNRTDKEKPENRDRYNMAVAQEALCFVEQYPDRKEELIRRIKEGRVYVSPYLCNSLWAFQGVEGAIRTFYPARRLEREWGISIDVAEHIEEPSLPWGVVPILSGCGMKWVSNPFLTTDSTFGGLKNPPLFVYEGPDGSQVRVVMDPWASCKANYTQGAALLRNTDAVVNEWLPHYRKLGKDYAARAILASGTHGDISPGSGGGARGFADAIIKYNSGPAGRPRLVNATLPMFCKAVDDAQAQEPFLPTVRGCFGHSWDLWPIALAKYAAGMREGERALLAAEALLAVGARTQPKLQEAIRADRERAEWCLAMLSDHAWNGTDDRNKKHNADLRKKWSEDLAQLSEKLLQQGWPAVGPAGKAGDPGTTIFNPLSVPRADLVRVEHRSAVAVRFGGRFHPLQIAQEDGKRVVYFVCPTVPGFGLTSVEISGGPSIVKSPKLRATETELESPFYLIKVDPNTGGLGSIVHKATGMELVAGKNGRTLGQTVYFDGKEHLLTSVTSEPVADGAVFARLRLGGSAAGITVVNYVTVYADLDRVGFDLRITKPVTTKQERLCQVFPVMRDGATLRIETTGAVIRPRPQPEGDLLVGADTRRFAVQGFVDVSAPKGPGVTIAPIDAYALRMDLDAITFEALGNDQNYNEVVRDQHGVTEFRFRYSLRAHAGPYNQAEAVAWSRSAACPLLAAPGRLAGGQDVGAAITVDPARAIATCLKPAEGDASGACLLRLWETAGQVGPISIGVKGYTRAVQTDLLERDIRELPIAQEKLNIDLRAFGFGAVRLVP